MSEAELSKNLKEILKPYVGPLSLKDIENGFKLCTQNAEELLDDAKVLFGKKSYGRACALIILSEEEIAKSLMLSTAVVLDKNDSKSWKKFWRRFRKHKAKQDDLCLFDYFMCPSVSADDTLKEMESPFIERLKQLGFYIDNVDGKFVSPSMFFSDKKVKHFVEVELDLAENRLKRMKEINENVTADILQKVRNTVKKKKRLNLKDVMEQYQKLLVK